MRKQMRLPDFIRAEIEPILQNWEEFAKTIFHAGHMGRSGLRDHARDMLMVIADDLDSRQSPSQQLAKSKGLGPLHREESWAEVHGADRQTSGFSVMETSSEFRALRTSVVSLWTKAYPKVASQQLDDLTRFHEAIDQAVAESLEQYATEKELETRLFGAILVASPDPIYVLDLRGRFIYANKAATDLFALQPDAVIGKSTFDLGFPFAPEFQRNQEMVIAEQTTYRGRFIHRFTSGQGDRFEYLLAPVLDEHGKTEATVCIFRDVTEQVLAEEKVWHNAHHDPLTGLPNRRLFQDRLEQEVKHANRSSLPFALLFLDLDGFKEVNDSLGHEAGDRVLRDVAGRLTGCVREDDTVARLGGDEFTIILTGAKQPKDIDLVGRTIVDALGLPFHVSTQPVSITVSIGVAFYPRDASSPIDLLSVADQAMFKAKNSGCNRVWFYGGKENAATRDTASISS